MIATASSLLERLGAAAGEPVRREAERSLERLAARCGGRPLESLKILLPFGGGKDSAYTLAYVRLMQLLLQERAGHTFQVHVLLMIHPGVPAGVFENIDNVFRALEIEGDPDLRVFATALHGEPVALRPGAICSDHLEVFRQEVLIAGHLSQGNGRETFCYSCNFLLMNVISRYVASQGGAIDFVITGDSAREAVGYWRWVQKAARRFGLDPVPRQRAGWGSLFGKLAEINDVYYRSLLGPAALAPGSPYLFPNVDRPDLRTPEYFGVFEETSYEFWSHAAFLRGFLGFELREDAFNFTESDCRNPILMAHLRGLLADFEGRGYVCGVREYLGFAEELMRQKAYDAAMIERALEPYLTDQGILARRSTAETYAWGHYRLTPFQLAGLVASPISDDAARLEAFLLWQGRSSPGLSEMLRGYLKALRERLSGDPDLSGEEVESRAAGDFLRSWSEEDLEQACRFFHQDLGLRPESLRRLALRQTVSHSFHNMAEIQLVRLGDPHQRNVRTSGANPILTGR
jgi:hypothetical protein